MSKDDQSSAESEAQTWTQLQTNPQAITQKPTLYNYLALIQYECTCLTLLLACFWY